MGFGPIGNVICFKNDKESQWPKSQQEMKNSTSSMLPSFNLVCEHFVIWRCRKDRKVKQNELPSGY